MSQTNFINLYPNEYIQDFHYYPFAIKSEDLNLSLFYIIAGIKKSKALT